MAKTIIVSPSEIDTARQCAKKHEWAYKERWVGAVLGPALRKGNRWHEVLELHYNVLHFFQQVEAGKWPELGPTLGPPLTEDQKLEVCAEHVMLLLTPDDPIDELIWWMYEGHVSHWGADEQWKILGVEMRGEFWLPNGNGNRSRFKQKTKMDLVVRDLHLGGNWIVDHKSGKDLPKGKELDLADQFGLYEWGLRSIGKSILGTIHSAARTHKNVDQTKHPQPLETRFSRTRMSRTDIELDTIATEAYRKMASTYAYPEGEAPRSPNPDQCRWRCDYTDVCLISRKGVDQHDALADFGFHQDFTRH